MKYKGGMWGFLPTTPINVERTPQASCLFLCGGGVEFTPRWGRYLGSTPKEVADLGLGVTLNLCVMRWYSTVVQYGPANKKK